MKELPLSFWLNIDCHNQVDSGCWYWRCAIDAQGYGVTTIKNGTRLVHRIVYENLVKSVPPGFELDHLCRCKSCCNPYHLEIVTHQENVKRGLAGKNTILAAKTMTTCKKGHAWISENIVLRKSGKKLCKLCKRKYERNKRKVK